MGKWVGIIAVAFLVAFILAFSKAHGATLTCVAPAAGQRWTRIFDPDINDSTWSVECHGDEAIHDTMWVTLWRQSLTGGGYSPSDSAHVAPGDSVWFFSVGPGHYYAIARNGIGPSCVIQDPVYVPPPVVTGVPVVAVDPVDELRVFNVMGQLVATVRGTPAEFAWQSRMLSRPSLAMGIYYGRARTASGVILAERRRIVIVR
jgi:hypothetical protein